MLRRCSILLALALLAACAELASPRFTGTAVLPVQAAPDFTLTADDGSAWTLSRQHGRALALFFGFTHCADTCPLTLAKLAAAIAHLGPKERDAEVAFVTIDPARDTPAVLAAYDKHFRGGRIVGLSGTDRQIAAVERSYHVWAQRIPGKRGTVDYDEAHSAAIFLIDPTGNERVIHDPDDSTASIASDLRVLLQ